MEGPAVHATAPRQPWPLPSSPWPPEPSWRAGQAQGRTDMQAEPQFLHVQCSPHHLPAADGGGGASLCPRSHAVLRGWPSRPVWERPATRNGALAYLPPRRAKVPPLTRRLMLGWACGADVGGCTDRCRPRGSPWGAPCNPSQISAAPVLLRPTAPPPGAQCQPQRCS